MCDVDPYCEVLDASNESFCVCNIDGITAGVEGGDGVPDAWPPWPPWPPEPPLWPHPDYESWPVPPGTSNPEQPGCDLGAGECDVQAQLKCSTMVLRGTEATCTFSLDPQSPPLDAITGWAFVGDNGLSVSQPQQSPPQTMWKGVVVESGWVQVLFKVGGRDMMVMAHVDVLPRTDPQWDWSMASGITYDEGGLDTDPVLDWLDFTWGRLCHPDRGCGAPQASVPQDKWFVQPQNPSAGNGYSLVQITDDGPNHGAWYVSSVSVDVKMASAINPSFLPTGPLRPQGCGAADSLNTWGFNHSSCGTGDSGWGSTFTTFVWAHEGLHVQKGVSYLGARPQFVVPAAVESFVFTSASLFESEIDEVVENSGRCFGFAAAAHGDGLSSPAHTPAAFDVWWWNSVGLVFEKHDADTPYPSDDTPPTECS